MTVIVETSRALPIASFSVSLQAGRLHEPDGRHGLARVGARMLRRGCGGYDAEALEQQADMLGAEVASNVGLGWCTISCEVLSRNLEPAVELVASMLAEPTFDEEELGRLLRQSEAELVRSRDNDALLASRALRRHLFDGHPHAQRVQGTVDGLKAIDVAAARELHRALYTKAGAVVAFCGDVDDATAERLGQRLLERLPEGAPRPYPAPEPTPPKGRRLVLVDKPGRTQTQLAIGTLGTKPSDEDHYALWVANCAFGGTFTSRLVKEIRSERGWSYGVSSHLTTSRVRETFSVWAAPGAGDAAACAALELAMLGRWCEEGINPEELRFCKDYLRRSYAFEVDTAKKRLQQHLERALLDLPDDYHDGFVEKVDAVTLEQANEAIRRRISPDDLWVSAVVTAGTTGEELADAIEGLVERIVEPHDLE